MQLGLRGRGHMSLTDFPNKTQGKVYLVNYHIWLRVIDYSTINIVLYIIIIIIMYFLFFIFIISKYFCTAICRYTEDKMMAIG